MQKTKFKISGLKCDSCVILIEDRLKEKPGVITIKIDKESSKGVVIYDEQKIAERDIYETIKNINNFQIEKIEQLAEEFADQNSPIQKVKFRINGIKCGNCVILIEGRLKNKQGIVKVKVDRNSSKGVVVYDKQKINEVDIYRAIEEIGQFKVEKIERAEEGVENDLNYSNPEEESDARPPVEAKNNRGVYAFITVVVILFLLFTFGQKNNQGNQVVGSTQNAPVQQQQQAQQPSQVQQAQAVTLAKSDSPILETYVVSRCPFGLQMQRIMADVVKNIPSLANNVKVRYMGSVSSGIITSMHGNAEAQENLRQICLREEQPVKYWPYVSCQMKTGDTAGCETFSGVEGQKLSACVLDSSRGLAYAKKDFDLNAEYQIQGSPTLILGGQHVSEFDFGGRTSNAVKTLLCNGFNNQPTACSVKLSTATAATSFSETY